MLTKREIRPQSIGSPCLACSRRERIRCRDCRQNNISKKFLDAILLELRNDGILRSKKGPGGGYSLAKPASEINIGQAIRVLDGPLAPIRCASRTAYEPCEDCEDHKACQVRRSMLLVREAIVGVLDAMTLEQFARNGGLEDDGTAPEWAQLTA